LTPGPALGFNRTAGNFSKAGMERIPELHKLSADHHLGLVLARHARRAAEGMKGYSADEVWGEVEEKFQQELEPHFRIEEEFLAPPLDALGERALLQRFHEDHDRLRTIIRDRSARSLSDLKSFGERLERHIRFEERELFEIAQARLSRADLRIIGEACQGVGPG